jgi:hypothetical protein
VAIRVGDVIREMGLGEGATEEGLLSPLLLEDKAAEGDDTAVAVNAAKPVEKKDMKFR